MSDSKGGQEPSMEEILASIRRIIAEDTDAPAEAPAPEEPAPASASAPPSVAVRQPESEPEPEEDILELTEVVEEPPAISAASLLRDPEKFEEPPPPPRPAPAVSRLVSDAVAASSAASFASIANRRRLASDFPIGNGAATLEELTCSLLRPMLKEWLDANLPALVENLVQEEIQRLAREAL